MDKLFQYQSILLQGVKNDFLRYPFLKIPWKERFIGIKGLRGVGKTTLLLQHLKYNLTNSGKHLYVTLDHPYFYTNSLYELADTFYKLGGETLLVDEVHKMSNWSRQIKIIYDGLPKLQLIFTSSSALDIYRGKADLSRRVLTYSLAGMSFREYLHFNHGIQFDPIEFEDLLINHTKHADIVAGQCKPLALFRDYLIKGYFPFSKQLTANSFDVRLIQTLEIVLNEDLAYVEGYTADNIFKIKKLLGVLAESAPFTANISSIAEKMGIGRNTVIAYMYALEKAGLLNFLNREGKGVSTLQKPDKIYLENTNLAYALKLHPEPGTLRETFMLNQLKNAGKDVFLPVQGDITVITDQHQYTFEVGGKTKTSKQIKNIKNSFVVADDIETGFDTKIPLWMFGMLY